MFFTGAIFAFNLAEACGRVQLHSILSGQFVIADQEGGPIGGRIRRTRADAHVLNGLPDQAAKCSVSYATHFV
jgi:hypothetical protein